MRISSGDRGSAPWGGSCDGTGVRHRPAQAVRPVRGHSVRGQLRGVVDTEPPSAESGIGRGPRSAGHAPPRSTKKTAVPGADGPQLRMGRGRFRGPPVLLWHARPGALRPPMNSAPAGRCRIRCSPALIRKSGRGGLNPRPAERTDSDSRAGHQLMYRRGVVPVRRLLKEVEAAREAALADKEKIVLHYRSGKSISEINREYNAGEHWLAKQLRTWGVEIRMRGRNAATSGNVAGRE